MASSAKMESATPASQRSHCMSLLSIRRLGGVGWEACPQGCPDGGSLRLNHVTNSVVTAP